MKLKVKIKEEVVHALAHTSKIDKFYKDLTKIDDFLWIFAHFKASKS